MGGFAGGDEAGFWDEDKIATLVKKQKNKTAKQDKTIRFVSSQCDSFSIEGLDDGSIKESALYKAYQVLCQRVDDDELEEFFYRNKVVVVKESVSNKMNFLSLLRDECNLFLSNTELEELSNSIH